MIKILVVIDEENKLERQSISDPGYDAPNPEAALYSPDIYVVMICFTGLLA